MPSQVYLALSSSVRWFREHVLAPERRRHPLIRSLCRLLGTTLLAGVVAVGMLMVVALGIAAALQRLLRGDAPVRPVKNGQEVEGEYRVIKPDTDRPPKA